MENLIITEKNGNDFVVLTVSGSINSYSFGEFVEKINDHIKNTNVVLDMTHVTNMSSSGIGVLMSAYEDGEESGHKIYILNPSEIVRLAIDSTGFSDIFSFIHSLNEMT